MRSRLLFASILILCTATACKEAPVEEAPAVRPVKMMTIGGTQAIARFRANEIQRRIAALPPSRRRSAREEVTQEVDALLREHLFVELHGNAAGDLPAGPRYLKSWFAAVAREIERLPYDRIADAMGLPRNQVGMVLKRARERLASSITTTLNRVGLPSGRRAPTRRPT